MTTSTHKSRNVQVNATQKSHAMMARARLRRKVGDHTAGKRSESATATSIRGRLSARPGRRSSANRDPTPPGGTARASSGLPALLQLHNVCKRYGYVDVINGVSLQILDGEIIVFVGAGSSRSFNPMHDMTVRQNMSFASSPARAPRPERERKVAEAACMRHLKNYLDPKPGVLSGKHWQRIAIGRAIVHTGRALARNALQSQLVPG